MPKGMKKGTVFKKTLEKQKKLDELAQQGINANEAATILKMSTRDTYKYYQEKGYAIVPFNQKFHADCPQPPSMAVIWPVAVTGQPNNSHPQCHWHLQKSNLLSKI